MAVLALDSAKIVNVDRRRYLLPIRVFTAKTGTGASDVLEFPAIIQLAMQLVGITTGTVVLEVSNDGGTTYKQVAVTNMNTAATAVNMTADGLYEYYGHFDKARLNVTVATSIVLDAWFAGKTF